MNDEHERKLTELEETIRRQDVDHEARMAEITTETEETTMTDELDRTDANRLTLLDRIADRMPDLDLDEQGVEWKTLDDGVEALLINGGGVDGGSGAMVTAYGPDLHVTGSLAPLAPAVGLIVVRPDRTRVLARMVPDPLAGQEPGEPSG